METSISSSIGQRTDLLLRSRDCQVSSRWLLAQKKSSPELGCERRNYNKETLLFTIYPCHGNFV